MENDLLFIDVEGCPTNLECENESGSNLDSGNESECEVPKFQISAFKKFGSENKNAKPLVKENFHNKSIQLSSSLNAGKEYNKTTYVKYGVIKDDTQNQVNREEKILNECLKKSIVHQPGFAKLESVPTFQSRRQKRKAAAKERENSTGDQWYNMAKPEMTEEKKNDLLVLQMRQALDPKRFYKRSATINNPKFFEIGTFTESPLDFYSSRIPKKQRKQTLVDELLADAEFRQYQKKKFSEIQQTRAPRVVRRKKLTHKQRVEARTANVKTNTKKSKKNKKKA
ncbi:deoxynucleotidyltransferase terminal-interacting protein 2 [Caerostris extrusa]|uniref:Deoxynucleotidyltransferase terminal-interacting protein 2 n=1 Tax=Caerostris extrusa TaxID=172846 RepID=A0AAV4NVD1_CAEEX|nr:deoxynucleotidyltransferase terminal-interacting protein 2 [Caerostris extrusa]